MRLIAEAGTDVAAVVLFDPAALPHDFDTAVPRHYATLFSRLQSEGRLFHNETDSDGSYLLHLFVDAPLPADLVRFCSDPLTIEPFHVPSGTLWFCGAEYAFQRNDARLRKYPHMGTRLEVPPGMYSARFWQTEYPDEYVEDQVEAGTTPEEYRMNTSGFAQIVARLLRRPAPGEAARRKRLEIERDYPCIIGELHLRGEAPSAPIKLDNR